MAHGPLGGLTFDAVAGSPDTDASARPYVSGYYKSGQWRLPFPFKLTTYATTPAVSQAAIPMYGGEYKIYTRLQEVGRGPKDYGGVEGFSYWVDWRKQDSVFVSGLPGCTNSTVSPAGRSRSTPVCRPITGLQIAQTEGRPNVLVNLNNGNPYTGTVNMDGTAYGDGRTVYGGLDDKWLRQAPGDTITAPADGRSAIVGAVNTAPSSTTSPGYSATATGIYINGRANIRLRQLYVDSGPALGTGASAYGVRGNESSITIERSVVGAQQGSNGANGTTPSEGENGEAGRQGGEGHFWPSNFLDWVTNLLGGGNFFWDWWQAGGNGLSYPGHTGVRAGGIGGAGGGWWGDAQAGSDGGGGAKGGIGGNGSVFGTGNSPGGGAGGAGGAAGTSGAGGASTPASIGDTWVGRNGANGTTGGNGGGGGGGGGGMAASSWGGGGGGAGTGGAGGPGGTGGQAGGGSFGIYVHNTTLTVTHSRVTAGYGGKGGDGARGGHGGTGGAGGKGGNKSCCEATGGSGGGGGGGGGSGGGGGGGAGGPSIAIFGALSGGATNAMPTITPVNPRLEFGGAGDPGALGVAGTRGSGGDGGAIGDCQAVGLDGGKKCPGGGKAGSNGGQAGGAGAGIRGRFGKVWWNEAKVDGYYP
ncbi:hypothetical protein ACE2AJ_10750 [Aquihabitans daechungensis]|uniref:hypothetical protein n=1 Tax=Aquihabitans daechungensis TaxID=1052257 RepID=UPI003BA24650